MAFKPFLAGYAIARNGRVGFPGWDPTPPGGPGVSLHGTVLVCEPEFSIGGVMRGWLHSEICAPPNTVQNVSYSTIPLAGNGTTGAANLNTKLTTVGGHKIVFGHSMGAQIIYKWIREYGPTSAIDPEDVTFLVTGNPERKYGGVMRISPLPFGVVALYGGPGIPDSTPYRVIDFSRQYDQYSDYPNGTNINSEATRNLSIPVHNNYVQTSIYAKDNVWFPEGNIVYGTAPTNPLPNLQLIKNTSGAAKIDKKQRPVIESAYHRPKAIPYLYDYSTA